MFSSDFLRLLVILCRLRPTFSFSLPFSFVSSVFVLYEPFSFVSSVFVLYGQPI